MLDKKDALYFIDPVQVPPAINPKRPSTEAVLFKWRYARPRLNQLEPGEILSYKGFTLEEGEVYLISESGDYFLGAPLATSAEYGGPLLGFIGDKFLTGRSAGTVEDSRFVLIDGYVRRSDGRPPASTMYLPSATRAAIWADELMPQAGDTEAIVLKKLKLAKQRWEHRFKKSAIYREGLVREWLKDLQGVRDDGHDMPVPSFNIGVTGTVLIPTGHAQVEIPEGKVTEEQKSVLTTIAQGANTVRYGSFSGVSSNFREYVGTDFTTVTPWVTITDSEPSTMASINSYILRQLGVSRDAGAIIRETQRFAVLNNF